MLSRQVLAVKLTVPVREVRDSVGAGSIYPLPGEIRTMAGLGSQPAYMKVDVDEERKVAGFSVTHLQFG
ncbi:MAG TPA: formate--tetrahydrofolate ligase [Anaerolineales bacterium]|nr:formate--tetrahydrofolate ligase [Anaerolineales bacterium]